MVGVAAQAGWVLGGGLVLALACGGKAADSDDVFDEPGDGGKPAEETTGGRASATSGGRSPQATGAVGGEMAAVGGETAAVGGETAAVGGGGASSEPPSAGAGGAFDEYCGNGKVEAGEACDDGDGNQNNDCLNDCTLPTCGDGILHNLGTGDEVCDEGEENGWFPASCSPDCTFDDSCFDGEWQPERGEECDDDFKADTSSCTLSCRLNICGDGNAYLDETPGTNNTSTLHECDDANDDETDACTSDCAWNVCGDGFVFSKGYDVRYDASEDGNELDDNPNPVEECDDGNDEAGDGCFECQLED
jgi:hypothetical protein